MGAQFTLTRCLREGPHKNPGIAFGQHAAPPFIQIHSDAQLSQVLTNTTLCRNLSQEVFWFHH